jgi:hypothetical protein
MSILSQYIYIHHTTYVPCFFARTVDATKEANGVDDAEYGEFGGKPAGGYGGYTGGGYGDTKVDHLEILEFFQVGLAANIPAPSKVRGIVPLLVQKRKPSFKTKAT